MIKTTAGIFNQLNTFEILTMENTTALESLATSLATYLRI